MVGMKKVYTLSFHTVAINWEAGCLYKAELSKCPTRLGIITAIADFFSIPPETVRSQLGTGDYVLVLEGFTIGIFLPNGKRVNVALKISSARTETETPF